MDWVEFVLQESLNFWDDVVDVGSVEVGVVHHVHDDLVLPAPVDLFSGFDERSEHDPVVFVESLDLKGIVVEGSFPVAHEQVVLSFNFDCPIVNHDLVHNQQHVGVDAGCASWRSLWLGIVYQMYMFSCSNSAYSCHLVSNNLTI